MSSESHQSNTPDPRAQRRPDTPRPDARPQVATPNIFPTLREHNGYNAQVFGEAIDNAITSQNEAATSCSLESRIEPMHAIGTPAWDSLPQQNNEAPSIFSPCANNSLMEPNPFIGTNIQAALPRLGFSSDYTMAAAIDTPVVMGPPTRVPIPTHEIDPNDVNHYDTADDVAGLGQIPHYECSRCGFPGWTPSDVRLHIILGSMNQDGHRVIVNFVKFIGHSPDDKPPHWNFVHNQTVFEYWIGREIPSHQLYQVSRYGQGADAIDYHWL